MKPILLIHGYSTEGRNNTVQAIYGSLPDDLRKEFGESVITEIDLSRWISLDDGVSLDDVAFAMDRALHSTEHEHLLKSGFHVIIHSTGALVTRNWIKNHSPKPSPIINFIHLAGANFGSGLAHIGRGQLARWGRKIFGGTESGIQVLRELEFGAGKTLDLHLHFRKKGNGMLADYQVQEYCLIGSQIPELMRPLPIRYVKEDSSDCTVRVAAGNLNFAYICIEPKPEYLSSDGPLLTAAKVTTMIKLRRRKKSVPVGAEYYHASTGEDMAAPIQIPFAVPFETAHIGDLSIVHGKATREQVLPLIKSALSVPENDPEAYQGRVEFFREATEETFRQAAQLKWKWREWYPRSQYEKHAMVIFRIRDQHGNSVEHFDLYLKSDTSQAKDAVSLPKLLEDKHINRYEKGTMTMYFRLQKSENGFEDLLDHVLGLDLEITGHEPLSDEILYVPFSHRLEPDDIRGLIKPLATTVVDVVLLRLPSSKVFAITREG